MKYELDVPLLLFIIAAIILIPTLSLVYLYFARKRVIGSLKEPLAWKSIYNDDHNSLGR
jgi:hypothetical protein